MGQLKFYKRQVGYPKIQLPFFCTVKIPIQSIVMQHHDRQKTSKNHIQTICISLQNSFC